MRTQVVKFLVICGMLALGTAIVKGLSELAIFIDSPIPHLSIGVCLWITIIFEWLWFLMKYFNDVMFALDRRS